MLCRVLFVDPICGLHSVTHSLDTRCQGSGDTQGLTFFLWGAGGSHGHTSNAVWLVLSCRHQPLLLLVNVLLHGRCCTSWALQALVVQAWNSGSSGQSLGPGAELTIICAYPDGLSFLSCIIWRKGARCNQWVPIRNLWISQLLQNHLSSYKELESGPSTPEILILGEFWNPYLYKDFLP